MGDRIKHLACVRKVAAEIKSHWGFDDKDLAEFIIDLAQNESANVDDFQEQLAENGAEATDTFAAHLYELILKMAPAKKVVGGSGGGGSTGSGGGPGGTSGKNVVVGTGASSSSSSSSAKSGSTTHERVGGISGIRAPRNQTEAQFVGLRMPDVAPEDKAEVYVEAGFVGRTERDKGDVGEKAWDLLEGEMTAHERKKGAKKGDKGKGKSGSNANAIPLGGKGGRGRSRSRSPPRDYRNMPPEEQEKIRQDALRRMKRRKLEKWGIYAGEVQKVMDYGAFVSIETTEGRKEGLCHAQYLTKTEDAAGGSRPDQLVKRKQEIFVKIVGMTGSKISLSMLEVDQISGEDLKPRDPETGLPINSRANAGGGTGTGGGSVFGGPGGGPGQNKPASKNRSHGEHTGVNLNIPDTLGGKYKDRNKKKMNDYEKWENQQLYMSGVIKRTERMDYDPRGDGGFLVDEEIEEDYEVDVKEQEPAFLLNQTTKSGAQLSPIKLVKNPEGSLAQAASNAAAAIKETRQARDAMQQEALDNIPKDMNKPWEDPKPDPGSRALVAQIRGLTDSGYELPEWKKLYQKNAGVSLGQKSNKSIKEQREGLPIFKLREPLLEAIIGNQVLVVIGETGSGKTTQITQYCAEAGFTSKGIIGCTQPRRVAAMSVAKRVAEEFGCRLGQEVGYSIRFEDQTSRDTVIKYMTDGMLMREMLVDPDLKRYSMVMLDEAHERTMTTDVLFCLLKKACKRRPDFKLIVTSATLDAEKFSSYFFNSKIFTIPGRTHPVEINYSLEPCEDSYVDTALMCIMEIHLREPAGDILLFLTGQEEIDTAAQILHERMKALESNNPPPLIILPVYSALPSEMQSMIFEPAPAGCRKVVIATNIAEASLTIDGIYYVVDPGMAKQKCYNAKSGMDSLLIVPISQASAKQRAGRAGRTGPGKCFRLYTEAAYKNEMSPMNVPEIQRTNLSNVVLVLKAMGVNDLLGFDFMDPPPIQTLINSLESLWTLGALDNEGMLTRLGRKMADFPLEPAKSKTLLVGVDLDCADEIMTILAMLEVQNVFYRPREKQTLADQKKSQFHQAEGDHITLLEVYKAWARNRFSSPWCFENFVQVRSLKRAQEVRKQLIGILDRYQLEIKSCGADYNRLRKTICAGYFNHACKRDPKAEGYKTLLDNQTVHVHPSSSLYQKAPEWIVYHELVLTTKEYLREVCTIEPHWLPELAPNLFSKADENRISKRKMYETIEPLYNRFEEKNSWRLSRRQG
ncbi:unnamed protein product [Amoebophrya sp. A25]|nr:unnamed protein product [Amoebophrya sp. A25]|eukprot:GSA25T00027084001.1